MRRRPLDTLALLALTACGNVAVGDGAFTVRDSAGVQLAESAAPDPAGPPRLAATPRLDIGAREGDAAYLLSRITRAIRRADGAVIVADAAAGVVRVYDGSGTHIMAIGGPGDGPGEFRSISSLWLLPGDSLGIYDSRHRRVSVVGPDGSLAREIALRPPQAAVTALPLPDGSLVSIIPPPPRRGGADGLERPMAAVVRYDADGVLRDTLARVPGPRTQMLDMGDRSFAMVFSPWGGNSYAAVSDSGIVIGTAESCEVRRLRADGSLAAVMRWQCDLALTDAHVEQWKRHMLEGVADDGPAAVDAMQSLVERTLIPERRAAYDAFLVAADGSLWLPESTLQGSDPRHWTVLDALGRWLGELTMPERFVPLEIGRDYVLGRWRDELDVQHVRLYDILR